MTLNSFQQPKIIKELPSFIQKLKQKLFYKPQIEEKQLESFEFEDQLNEEDSQDIFFQKKVEEYEEKKNYQNNSFFSENNILKDDDENLSVSENNTMEFIKGNREIDLFGVKKIDSDMNIFNDTSQQNLSSSQNDMIITNNKDKYLQPYYEDDGTTYNVSKIIQKIQEEYQYYGQNENKIYEKNINQKFYDKIREHSVKITYLLNISLFREQNGNLIIAKYEILDQIIESTFSYVYLVKDIKTQKLYCMKKIKNDKEFFDQSLMEVYILKYLQKVGHPDQKHFLNMKEFFYYNNHLYIITEQLGESLLEKYIEKKIQPNTEQMQRILHCLFVTLEFLETKGIYHCDIKPENILFYQNSDNVKLIDFGSASFCDEDDFYYLQTKPYRSPEMIMGQKYNFSIDIWSIGCIIYELITFKLLFYYRNPLEIIAKAMAINKNYDFSFYQTGSQYQRCTMQKKYIMDNSANDGIIEIILPKNNFDLEQDLLSYNCDPKLIDLVLKCLKLNPNERISAKEALNHPYFYNQNYLIKISIFSFIIFACFGN